MASATKSKVCSACKQEKNIENFGKRPEYRDGYRNQCNSCRSAQTARYMKTPAGANTRRHRETESYRHKDRWAARKRKYGLDETAFDALLAQQDGGCALCGSKVPGGRYDVFHVDHCHQTGRVRGLLCHGCNSALGRLGDTAESIERVLAYLR